MDSKLNNAAEKKDLELGVTVFIQGEKEIEFPPATTTKYPVAISERALREYIARGGEVVVIPLEKEKKTVKDKEEVNSIEK